MAERTRQVVCEDCGFDLWLPISDLRRSSLGLYDDARFPGRSILALRDHYDHLEDVPARVLQSFMADVRLSVNIIKDATHVDRVNVAILGNRDNHVHAHLIPRYPSREVKPDSSPWDDPRDKTQLAGADLDNLMQSLRAAAYEVNRSKRLRPRTRSRPEPLPLF